MAKLHLLLTLSLCVLLPLCTASPADDISASTSSTTIAAAIPETSSSSNLNRLQHFRSRALAARSRSLAAKWPIKNFVLVHSWFQGPWVWNKVARYFRASGLTVTVVQLPTSASVRNATDLAGPVIAALKASPNAVLLAGLGYGALAAATAAEAVPGKVARLVYVSGLLLPPGATPWTALQGRIPELTKNTKEVGNTLAITSRPAIRQLLYNQSSAADQADGVTKYHAEPLGPLTSTLGISNGRWGSVKRYYVYSEKDVAIPYATQRWMVANVRAIRTYTIKTSDHTVPLSKPWPLVWSLWQIMVKP